MITGVAYGVSTAALSLISLVLCFRFQKPKWWPLAVLACPVFVLGLLAGIRPRRRIFMVLVVAMLAGVTGLEIYTYQLNKEKNKYAHLPPVVQEMIRLNEDVMNTTIALYDASARLDSLGLVQSRISDIRTTLDHLANITMLLDNNQAAIERLIRFLQDHSDYIQRQGLDWAFLIRTFYEHPQISQHSRQRKQYLTAFQNLLQYTLDNFDNIMELKSSQHLANYDAWYLRYRGVADLLNQANRKRVAYQNEFITAHPEVSPFLPGTHQLKPFKFWDKFSF